MIKKKNNIQGSNGSGGGAIAIVENENIKIQTNKLTELAYKIFTKSPIRIVYQGDSDVYGHDIVSADIRPAEGMTDSGVVNTFTRASITTPEALESFLREAIGHVRINVINKGHSGDWADLSYDHWTTNENADLAIIQIGGNDMWLGADWVDDAVERNIEVYCNAIRKLVKRFNDWGTPVVLHTPLKIREQEAIDGNNSDIMPEPARIAIINLGKELNCPVIDMDDLLSGCDYTYWSDTVHLNGKGYEYVGARLVSNFITGFNNIPTVKGGMHLGVRASRDMFINHGCVFAEHADSSGAEEGTSGTGILLAMPSGSSVYYGFDVQEEGLIMIPVLSLAGGASCKITLDFGVEQASYTISQAVKSLPNYSKPLSSITTYSNVDGAMVYDGTINKTTTDRYLQINQRGIHNIKVEAIGGDVYFNGFICVSYWDFV